jgi:hypothetical protein
MLLVVVQRRVLRDSVIFVSRLIIVPALTNVGADIASLFANVYTIYDTCSILKLH